MGHVRIHGIMECEPALLGIPPGEIIKMLCYIVLQRNLMQSMYMCKQSEGCVIIMVCDQEDWCVTKRMGVRVTSRMGV